MRCCSQMRFKFAMAVSDLGVCPATYNRNVRSSTCLGLALAAGRRAGFLAVFLGGLLMVLSSPFFSFAPFDSAPTCGWRPFPTAPAPPCDPALLPAGPAPAGHAAPPSDLLAIRRSELRAP